MSPSRELPTDVTSTHDLSHAGTTRSSYAEILLRVLAVSGYGLWIWLGMGLTLGMNQIGNGAMQMPLVLGTALVCAGLALGGLRLSANTARYGGPPAERRRPKRAARMALACLLPVRMLLVLREGPGQV
jgi:hypothetical protein